MSVIVGHRWQDVLDHRVELAAVPEVGAPGSSTWGAGLWGSALWSEGWAPPFTDVTPDVLHVHTTRGALGLDLSPGIGTMEVELLDLAGQYTPELLGRHLRMAVTPLDREAAPVFYGIIDRVEAGGTFALPTVNVTAYDVRSTIAATGSSTAVGAAPATSSTRLRAILTVAGFPAASQLVEEDTTTLLGDDTVELGDLFDRTVESSAGLAWADARGRIVTRGRDWVAGTAPELSAYVYAGTPPGPPIAGLPIAQTTGDLNAVEAVETVRNWITYANRADPPVTVTVHDPESIGRYGYRRSQTTDLACDLGLLEELAARALDLQAFPVTVVEGATVTVYDADTAAVATLDLGAMVIVGRNDPGIDVWEFIGVVAGVELTVDPDSFDVTLTVLHAGSVGGGVALWDSGLWDVDKWAPTLVLHTVWTMGPSSADRLDAGNIMGPAPSTRSSD